SRNGRPGSRGSRRQARARVRGACRRERGDEPDTDGRADFSEFANGGAPSAAQIYFVIGLPQRTIIAGEAKPSRLPAWGRHCLVAALLAMTRCGSPDAGGEDVGYFATMGKAGSTPAFEVTHCGGAQARVATRHSAGVSARSACVDSLKADIACSPAYPSN